MIGVTHQLMARVAHGANREICLHFGDTSQVNWDDAPDWQKESSLKGVEFLINNPEAGPSATHENWSKDKLADGWKFGPVKDAEKKEHPCLVAYDQLPAEQRMKDHVFLAVVRTLFAFGQTNWEAIQASRLVG